MKRILASLLLFLAMTWAYGQQPTGAPNVRRDYRDLIMWAIQDIDGMDYSSAELEWQLDRIEARKSATALIRAAQNDQEFQIAGAVWDLFQNKVTCRVEAHAGMSLDQCRANMERLRGLALAEANIDPRRLYSHSSVSSPGK